MEQKKSPENIHKLIRTIKDQGEFTPAVARKILNESEIVAEDLQNWANYEHPKADSYGRKLVYDGEYFELMVMSWVDGDMAAIHDHGHTQWGAVKLLGPAEHAVFKRENDKITTVSRVVCKPGTVLAVDHDMIHQMGNVGQAPYLTLHLYGSYDFDGGVTSDTRLYDLDEGKIQFTDGGVFFDLPEEQINRREDSPKGDFPTVLRCKTELVKRLLRKNHSFEKQRCCSEREDRILTELLDGQTWEMLYHELNELGNRTDKKIANYKNILDQELYSVARLKARVFDSDIVKQSRNGLKQKLFELSDAQPSEDFSKRYLRLIETEINGNTPLREVYPS